MIEIATRAARKAGQVILEMYRGSHEIQVKGERDIVTQADLAAEDLIIKEILAGCPDAWIISEERYGHRTAHPERPSWYIDPLDGTTNFARGLPSFCVSIAMAQAGELVCGAVYDPLRDQLFYAQRGQGAYLNEDRLQVSDEENLTGAIVLLDWPREQDFRIKSGRALQNLLPLTSAVRSTGCAALSLCYIAAGWADLYYQYTLSPWDVAAGMLLIQEAGGKITGMDGRAPDLQQRDWLATNGRLHSHVLEVAPFDLAES